MPETAAVFCLAEAPEPAVCHSTFLWRPGGGEDIFIVIRRGKEHTEKMKMDERVYRELFTELEGYEKRGVDMSLDGYRASPLEIVTAHMAREEGTYMRDYVLSREGNIQALAFTDIHEYSQEQKTP